MEATTTVTIEFTSDTRQHLKALEHQLKHIHDVGVELVEPRDHKAPALVAIGIEKTGARGEAAAQNIAQVLYNFLHDEASAHFNKTINLVTIEGERTDIEPLSVQQIKEIIAAAREGEVD
jgi:site-specific recombinase XerD